MAETRSRLNQMAEEDPFGMGWPPMTNLIDTNVWIDALSGKLAAPAFLKIAV